MLVLIISAMVFPIHYRPHRFIVLGKVNVSGKLMVNPGEVHSFNPVHDLLVQLGAANKHDLEGPGLGGDLYGIFDGMNNRAIRRTEAGIVCDYDVGPVGQCVPYRGISLAAHHDGLAGCGCLEMPEVGR